MRPFRLGHAATVAGWVALDRVLFWLAPQTAPPLTAAKVAAWQRRGTHSFVYCLCEDDEPAGYGEINDLQGAPGLGWIGHLVIDPAHRGQGHGGEFLRQLTDYGFAELGYRSVYLVAFPENLAAIRCYEHAGYVFDGYEEKTFEDGTGRQRMVRMIIGPRRSAITRIGRRCRAAARSRVASH